MSVEEGWAIARAGYQNSGNLADAQIPSCIDTDAKRTGWMEACRHFWITGTVPPTRPVEPVEEPANMQAWDVKPWDNAQAQMDSLYTEPLADVVFLDWPNAIVALRNVGLDGYVLDTVNCGSGYPAGKVCYQVPTYTSASRVKPSCSVALRVSHYPSLP